MRTFLMAFICAGLPITAAAQTFTAINRLQVVPIGGGDFEVIEARGEGARGMWCAAADYAVKRGQQGRLYVKTPRGPSAVAKGRKGVVFTTNPARLSVEAKRSVSVSVRIAGESLPINHAVQFCRDYEIERKERLFRLLGD